MTPSESIRSDAVAEGRTPADGAATEERFVFPTSFAQQRLWVLNQFAPASPLYNITYSIRLRGPLHAEILHRALREMVRRHEPLRTTFGTVNAEPVQLIAPDRSLDLPVVDLSQLPPDQQDAQVARLCLEEARRPFRLAEDLMLRAQFLRLAPQEHRLLLTMHHIASDDWSVGVLFRELGALYNALSQGQPSPLPELPIQYADFAAWQRDWLQGEILQKQLSYWKEQLAGAPALLELPADRPRPPVQRNRGHMQAASFSASLRDALQKLGQQEKATLFMTLLAAFQTLLYRFSGQEDVVVGSPIAGRHTPETEGLIGLFINTLVLRADLSGNPTFRELLRQVRETAWEAYAHQDLPFEKLVEELHPERNLSYSPLCQILLAYQNTPVEPLELNGLSLETELVHSQTAKFDLTLYLRDGKPGLAALVEYNTDLYDAATIQRLVGHFQVLLENIAANPDRRVGELPLLTAAERDQVLVQWNDTRVDYPREVCLHQLFEAQVARTPEAVAVTFEDQQLTYRELDARANQLAHHLRSLGVGVETFVGLCLERSLEMVVGIYGTLKAGAAYVPIDPSYPPERRAFMLQDANAPVLLTQEKLRGQLPSSGAQVVCLDSAWPAISRESTAAPQVAVTAENLAYMIYTSGSTGQPKGAMNTHRGIGNRLLWMQDEYRLRAADAILQKTPFSFDVSVWEFFWPLLAGARLVMAQPGGHRDPAYLVHAIEQHQITVLHFVPSMLQVFLEASGLERCGSLRHVICSGEALPFELQERFFAKLPAQLHNLYGPTEAAVDVTYWACQRDSPRRVVPIGRPVANTQCYILDARLEPVPIGVAGELHLGGVQIGRGYHRRPELTREKFIPDPFRPEPGARLYKTGDLARHLPDGTIEYLGRLDRQVKIRGFRIELEEIQSVLEQQAQVRASVVLAREDVPGDKRLVAYVVAQGAVAPTAAELRSFLGKKLPDHMIPAAFVMLAALPLSPNGKVDYRALPAPDRQPSDPDRPFVAPRTPTEQAVARIWGEVLKLDQIGVHDNFFELGGQSLLAVQVGSRLQAAYQVRFPLHLLFENPTVTDLASHIDALRWAMQGQDRSAPQPTAGLVTGEL